MDYVVIHPHVELGEGHSLGNFVLLGEPPRGAQPGEIPLIIGARATIRSHTTIYAGNRIGSDFQSGHHVLIRESNSIGDNVSVGTGTVIEHHVTIAEKVRIHSQAFIPEYTTIERGAWVGPNVVITNARYPNTPSTKHELRGAHLEEGCMIGANSTLLPGVRIGKFALVGAGSVVTRDVSPGAVVVGNPAVSKGSTQDIEQYKFLFAQKGVV